MSTQIKNYAGMAGILALIVASFAAASFARTYSRAVEPSSFRSFVVSGEGEVVAVPDVAQFSFSVISEGKTLSDVQKSATEKSNGAISYLKAQGVEAEDIRTTNYSVEPQYEYYRCDGPRSLSAPSVSCPPPQIVGYVVRQSQSVKVRDFAKIGDIMGGVTAEGANQVSGLFFTLDDPSAKENEARARAIEAAKEKAHALARAGDFRVGRLLNISEGGFRPHYETTVRSLAIDAKEDGFVPPTIEPGSEEIRITVTLTYEIK